MRRLVELLTPSGGSRVLGASVVLGVVVACVVALFEQLTAEVVLHEVVELPLWQIALAPTVGLILTHLILRTLGQGASTSTSDEYNKAFHERSPRLRLRDMPAKLLAGVATIGFGGSLGLEGPSIYAGSTTGLAIGQRLTRLLGRDGAHLLLTAGAAAGVSAVFKAPATGVIFALEAPYREDVAHRALLPALFASAVSYVTYISLVGPDPVLPLLGPLFQVSGREDTSFITALELENLTDVRIQDIFGAVALGLAAGLGGRAVAWLVSRAKDLSHDVHVVPRIAVAGALLGGLALLADATLDSPLTIGPGERAVDWVLEPGHGLGFIALLFGLKMAAIATSLAGGGVGGLFIPLVTLGTILGQFTGEAIGSDRAGLYPTLGLAAFLGAGYRVPITAVMFVGEVSPVSSFVVPALVAAAFSQVVAGATSVAKYQRSERLGHLERRFTLPITTVLETDVLTVPSDATAAEFVYGHVLGRRERAVPVVDDGTYVGMMTLDELSTIERSAWDETPVAAVMDAEATAANPSWTLRDAVAAMGSEARAIMAVTDRDGVFIGVLREEDIVKLDEILDETGG